MSAERARDLIQKQLDEGDALLKRNVQTSEALEGFRLSAEAWADYTFEVLRTVFSTPEYANSFRSWVQIGAYNVYESENEKFNRLHKRLRNQWNEVQGAQRKIDLLQPESAMPRAFEPPQARPSTTINIDFHAPVSGSAVNVGQIVHDIQNNLNQIKGQSADKFGQGIKLVVESINSDQSLSAGQKQEALESVEYLSEAAKEPPEKRKTGLVKAALGHIPSVLKTAQAAGEAWTTWEPQIRRFLGQ